MKGIPNLFKELEKIREEIEKKRVETSADTTEYVAKRLIDKFPNLAEYAIEKALTKGSQGIINIIDYAFNSLPKENRIKIANTIFKNLPSKRKKEYLSKKEKIEIAREITEQGFKLYERV